MYIQSKSYTVVCRESLYTVLHVTFFDCGSYTYHHSFFYLHTYMYFMFNFVKQKIDWKYLVWKLKLDNNDWYFCQYAGCKFPFPILKKATKFGHYLIFSFKFRIYNWCFIGIRELGESIQYSLLIYTST